ncbi:hypothetical protein D3C80_1855050 [compost metagenome]
MLAEVMHETAYQTYRRRLETWLQIPLDASEQDIHEFIMGGLVRECRDGLQPGCIQPSSAPSDHFACCPQHSVGSRSAPE